MRAFDQLTKSGRVGRLRLLATDTLRNQFGLEPSRVSLLASHSFNTLFRAQMAGGQPLAVRVGEVRIHADRVEDVEADWLRALRAETDLLVPTLLADLAGNNVSAGAHPLVPGPRYCSVMTWAQGRLVRRQFDHNIARRLGALQAILHEHAAAYSPPEIPLGIIAKRVVYFANTSLLAGYESAHGSMFVEAIDRVQAHLDVLWKIPLHRPHLLHGDFGPQNVMRYRSILTPIDFQDLQFGFDVQDVAITVADLRRVFHDQSLIEDFAVGYRSVRPWPLTDESLARALAAGRSLNVINLGLNLRRPGLPEFIDRHSRLVAEWMTGLEPNSTVI